MDGEASGGRRGSPRTSAAANRPGMCGAHAGAAVPQRPLSAGGGLLSVQSSITGGGMGLPAALAQRKFLEIPGVSAQEGGHPSWENLADSCVNPYFMAGKLKLGKLKRVMMTSPKTAGAKDWTRGLRPSSGAMRRPGVR